VSVTKTAPAGPVTAGNTITYTINVSNLGPNDAQTVALSDVIPANTTFVSDTQTSGPTFTFNNPAVGGTGTISGTINLLASEASASFTVVVLVSPNTLNGATITNTASVTSITNDPDLDNNSQTVATNVLNAAPSVSGTVFLDLNATGTIAAGDPGLAGRIVYVDLHGDATLHPDDPQAVTDAAGHFTIAGLVPNLYIFRLKTYPNDDPTRLHGDQIALNLLNGLDVTTANFGLQPGSTVVPRTPTAIPFAGGTTTQGAVIESMYCTILGRQGEPAGIQLWTDKFQAGETYSEIATEFLQSSEYRSDVIESYYVTFLGRGAEPAEMAGWLAAFEAGWTETQISEAFVSSAEYNSLHATDADFVSSLYANFLGRDATPSEVTNWDAQLGAGMTRSVLAADVIQSTEAYLRGIDGDYTAFLARVGEAPGIAVWLTEVQQGTMTLAGVEADFFNTPEFIGRATVSG
jgi:uncharacterized repeat protein (TIGR01451 family)